MGHPLLTHHPLTLLDRFERGTSVLWQMVRLRIRRIVAFHHIAAECLDRFRNQRSRVRIAPHKFRRRSESEIDQIMEDQDLAIAIRAGANSDGRAFRLPR